MEADILTILTQAGSSGIVGLMFIAYLYFNSKKKADTLVIKDDDRNHDTDEVAQKLEHQDQVQIAVLTSLMNSHFKSNEESFSTTHNGLHSLELKIDEQNKTITDLVTSIAVLKNCLEERLPKK